MYSRLFAAMGIAGLISLSALPASASVYSVSGSVNGDPFTASFSLTVSGGQATGGTGAISGGGMTGTQSLTLVTLATPGVENDGGGLLGYRSNDGTDWFGAGTAVPIDGNGLIFAIGPNPVGFGTSQQFDIYSVGPGAYDVGFFGKAEPGIAPAYWTYNVPVDVSVSAVPEASTWAMMLIAFAGMGVAGYGAQRRKAARA
jgi:hypothetical protein